jgi:2'-5' RNA ligase
VTGLRRLFVAAYLSPEALADLGSIVDTLEVSRANAPGRSTRLAPTERWHVTLAFIGEVPPDVAERAQAALSGVTDAPIDVSIAGGGTFGRGRAAVLWAGLAGDVIHLRGLATHVRQALRRAKVPFDDKAFRPHLTLARPGERLARADLEADVYRLDAYAGPVWTVDAVHLVDSQLGPNPVHTPIASFPVTGS